MNWPKRKPATKLRLSHYSRMSNYWKKTLAVTETCTCTDEKTHNYITGIYEKNSKLVMENKA